MSTRTTSDEDALRVGRAIETLRRRVGISQADAAKASAPTMTPQYWAMHESGRVPGIFKPQVQRKLIDALNAASGQEPPLAIDDLEDVLSGGGRVAPESRLAQVAREAHALAEGPAPPYVHPGSRQLVIPTRDGDVVFVFPGDMTPKGFRELEDYFAVFMKHRREDDDA